MQRFINQDYNMEERCLLPVRPAMLPFFTDNHTALQAQVRNWAEKNLLAASEPEEDLERRARALVRQLGAVGFLKHAVPRQFGGARDVRAYTAEDIRFTAKGDTLYAFVMAWPESGRVTLKSLARPRTPSPRPCLPIFQASATRMEKSSIGSPSSDFT